jgi:hypothetical protein
MRTAASMTLLLLGPHRFERKKTPLFAVSCLFLFFIYFSFAPFLAHSLQGFLIVWFVSVQNFVSQAMDVYAAPYHPYGTLCCEDYVTEVLPLGNIVEVCHFTTFCLSFFFFFCPSQRARACIHHMTPVQTTRACFALNCPGWRTRIFWRDIWSAGHARQLPAQGRPLPHSELATCRWQAWVIPRIPNGHHHALRASSKRNAAA